MLRLISVVILSTLLARYNSAYLQTFCVNYTTKYSFLSLSNYCQISLPYSVPSFLVGFYAKVDLPYFGA